MNMINNTVMRSEMKDTIAMNFIHFVFPISIGIVYNNIFLQLETRDHEI